MIIGAMEQFKIPKDIAANDIVTMGVLPPGCVLTELRAEWSGAEMTVKQKISSPPILHFDIIRSSLFDDDEPYITPEDQITDDLPVTWETCSASLSRLYKQLACVKDRWADREREERWVGFKVGIDMEYLAGNTVTLFYAYGQMQ